MKWFKHDSNAHTDTKLRRIKHKYGMVGYGLYWYCVELIAGKIDKENISFELEDDAEIIAIDWNLDQLKVEEMMRYFVEIGLFEANNNVITCLKLAKRLDDTNAKNPEIKKIVEKLRENQNDSELIGNTPNYSEKVGENNSDEKQQVTDPPNYSEKLRESPTRLDESRLEENIKPSSTSSSDPREKFVMASDWVPDIQPDQLKLLEHRGMTPDIYDDQLNAYRLAKIGRDGDTRTQHQWSQSFLTTLNKHCTKMQGNQNATNQKSSGSSFNAASAIASAPGADGSNSAY